jgi:hypothetical protein
MMRYKYTSMQLCLLLGLSSLVLATFVYLCLNHPSILRYNVDYSRDLGLHGRGSGYFSAEYFDLTLGYPELIVLADGTQVIRPLDLSTPLKIRLDGQTLLVSDLTVSLMEELEAKGPYQDNAYMVSWHKRTKRGSLACRFSDGRLVGLTITNDRPLKPHHSRKLGIELSWDDSEWFHLPISHSEMVRYFGRPATVDKYRMFN